MARHKVLLIDDDKLFHRFVHFCLDRSFELTGALSASAGIDMAIEEPFDAILLDFSMPEMDGLEACRHLRANPETMFVPVLFLTASTDQALMVRARQAGAADFLMKPVQPPDLIEKLHRAIGVPSARTSAVRFPDGPSTKIG